jgi:serine/threonine-protein kinase
MSRPRLSIVATLAPLLAVTLGTTAALADYYGAIAFSQDSGSVGYSYDYGNQNGAEQRALQECGDGGCMVVVWFRNACGALAIGDGNGYGTGWAVSQADAEQIALSNCSQYADNCDNNTWACTTR